jgi:hypothetical protein
MNYCNLPPNPHVKTAPMPPGRGRPGSLREPQGGHNSKKYFSTQIPLLKEITNNPKKFP